MIMGTLPRQHLSEQLLHHHCGAASYILGHSKHVQLCSGRKAQTRSRCNRLASSCCPAVQEQVYRASSKPAAALARCFCWRGSCHENPQTAGVMQPQPAGLYAATTCWAANSWAGHQDVQVLYAGTCRAMCVHMMA
jgi:hypothetical protein